MAWIYLILAGIFEIGWPLGLKMAQGNCKYLWIGIAIVSMVLSGYTLYLAQKTIPMGTAYAVWTSIGAVGTFFVGISLFGDPISMMRFLAIILIISGVILLKLST